MSKNQKVEKDVEEKKVDAFETFKNKDCVDTKIEIYINEIIKEYFKNNKTKIKNEEYSLDWGTKIVTEELVVQQEHEIGKKCHKIFIGSEKIFDGDMIRYDILNLKEKDLDKIRVKIDDVTTVDTEFGKYLLEKIKEKFIDKAEDEEETGAQKILEFMKKEKLNKDDLLMALSALFDEITGDKLDDKNVEDSESKNEVKELVEKHSEEMEKAGANTANLVKYKKSIFTKIIDWFYE